MRPLQFGEMKRSRDLIVCSLLDGAVACSLHHKAYPQQRDWSWHAASKVPRCHPAPVHGPSVLTVRARKPVVAPADAPASSRLTHYTSYRQRRKRRAPDISVWRALLKAPARASGRRSLLQVNLPSRKAHAPRRILVSGCALWPRCAPSYSSGSLARPGSSRRHSATRRGRGPSSRGPTP